ncbi:choice-of-anchor A family protein, partial [Phytoactinopolyspora endophytica]|uniref:choice-of-anchor A family protein n=1 Tax=Phytoactinopolyspora endophytica TaxID=1642495 RepID=UPI0013EA386A
MALAVSAAALPSPVGDCEGDECPTEWSPPHNGDLSGTDDAVNVFVGGDFTVIDDAAEAEGRTVVLRDAHIDRSSGQGYNVGVVGVGSRVPPPDGEDHFIIGGDLTISDGATVFLGGFDTTGTFVTGNLAYGGAQNFTDEQVDITGDGEVRQDPSAVDEYTSLPSVLGELSHCYGENAATGEIVEIGATATFTGDGESDLQVFTVDGTLPTDGDDPAMIEFQDIPDDATVLINVVGENADLALNSGELDADLTQRVLWNFPGASSVDLHGYAQLPGSILVGSADSTTTIDLPGTNGRVLTAGDLVHGGGFSSGNEMHSYPFVGEIPDCEETDEPGDDNGTDDGTGDDNGTDDGTGDDNGTDDGT